MAESLPARALYVHVPFCAAKCAYCDFYSVALSAKSVERYLNALEREAAGRVDELLRPVQTVFVGGGTPTSLPARQLESLLDVILRVAGEGVGEFTVEANPGTLDDAKFRILRQRGVNRISIGAQSFDDGILTVLGRIHHSIDIVRAVECAREAGFDNVGIDLIFAVPGQTVKAWRSDLARATALDVDHVSAYALTWEEGTPMHRALEAGTLRRVDEEDELAMYELAMDALTAAGYEHYEISNFAKPGRACAQNEVYWANDAYLGLGPAACSYVSGERLRNTASIDAYCERIESGESPVDFRERLDAEHRARETAVMNLRRTRGIDFAEFPRATGFDARELFAEQLQLHVNQGLMTVDAHGARLTRRGLALADSVLADWV